MTIPERQDEIAVEELAKEKSLGRLDRAYACWAYVGLFTIAMTAVVSLPSTEKKEGYGMLLVLPGMLLPIALVAAIVMTVRLRRHRALVFLSRSTLFLTIVFLAVGISDCCAEGLSEYAMNAVVGMYGVGAVLVPVWWFVIGRRHYRDNAITNT